MAGMLAISAWSPGALVEWMVNWMGLHMDTLPSASMSREVKLNFSHLCSDRSLPANTMPEIEY